MPTKLFVNLPVADLPRSRHFYTALGFTLNQRFSNEQAACVAISEHLFVMLLVKPFAEVLQMVDRAVAAGGTTPNPAKDHGFMFQHGFADPDGHQWEVFFMDEAAAPAQF
ncbi:MAG: glyoxalase/bleomycin resistance/extradiol dioxygenase family protein [Hydrogenophaga sp.]|nr:glyoxalase/bleomycin resistance/extradiol dioxygenase family protein [Hydrogenophaga sp.]